jgi:MATE family multidrug resistance protein
MSLTQHTPTGDESDGVVLPVDPAGPQSDLARMLRAAWPLIVINLAFTGMQFADALMVAPLGPEALAAIFPATMLFLVPVVFGHGVLAVVNTFVAQSLGGGRPRDCGTYALQGLWIAVLWGAILQVQTFWCGRYFDWMGHEAAVRLMEESYFRAVLPSAIPALVVVALSSFFTGLLRTRVLVAAALLAAGLNIFFNWLLIGGRWGFPALGVAGAAWGTTLATLCQAGFLLAFFWSRKTHEAYGTRGWRPARKPMVEILRVGAPSGGLPVFDLLTWGVIIVWMIGLFGTAHLAANTIVIRYLHLSFMPSFAIGGVLTAMVGQSLGAGDPLRARRQARTAFVLIAGYMVVIGLVFIAFREPFMRWFTDDPLVIRTGALIFFCVMAYQVFDAMFLTFSHALRGAGDTVWPTAVLLMLGTFVLVGGGLYMVRFYPELGSLGPWLSTTVYTMVLGSAMAWRWRSGAWENIRLVGEGERK